MKNQMALTRWKIAKTQDGYGEEGLILLAGDHDRILSLVKRADGLVTFMEECDGYFGVTMTKDEAKQALNEALTWIDET